jgi:hypothetical protein
MKYNIRYNIYAQCLCLTLHFLIIFQQPCYADIKDPTRPANISNINSSLQNIDLSAIFITPTAKLAILNKKIVNLGEKFEGLTLITIESNFVLLRSDAGNIIRLHVEIPIKIPSP